MSKLISIIVPVWNVDRYLEKCLDSILAQTYTDLQIILIDDGSTDYSGIICDEYAAKDSRIEVVHQKNAGVCHARNAALERVRGEYIGFVDPDDWIKPDMFEYLQRGMEIYSADISCCHYFRVCAGQEIYAQGDGNDYVYTAHEAVEELVNRFLLRNVFWNKLFKVSLFESITFPEGRIYEGTDMIYRLLLRAEKVVMLGEAKYYYVDNPKSYVNQDTLKHYCDYVYAHIHRYGDLIEDFKELQDKLLRDIAEGILKMRYLQNCTQEQIDKNKDDLEMIRQFVQEHESQMETVMSQKSERRELKHILRCSPNGIRCARYIGAFEHRLQLLRSLFGHGKGQKKKDVVTDNSPIVKRENQKKLRNIQLTELEILKEVDRICKENGIQYYLYGGTLLGAVRHHGFIPWDDDIDIVMHRSDYKRFKEVCKTQLGEHFFYQTCFTDSKFPMLFTKIRRNDSQVCEDKWDVNSMHSGIFIDILPLDRYPDNKVIGRILRGMESVVQQACALDRIHTKHIGVYILFGILKLFPRKARYLMREWILSLSNMVGGTKLVCSYGSHYQPTSKRVLKSEWFTGEETMQFEDGSFYVPKGWKEYLIHLYGEYYMELPPVEKREVHLNLSKVRFPKEDENEAL